MSAGFLTPYRAAGFVTDSTPAVVHRQGSQTFVVTSIGRSYQIYNCANLRMRFVSPQLPGRIRAMEVHRDMAFVAVGGEVHVVQRADVLGVLRGHARPVRHMAWLGELLVSVCAGRRLNAWRVLGKDAELDQPALTLQVPALAPEFPHLPLSLYIM
jgi:U3 small nucleolar RNA-associated protein 21